MKRLTPILLILAVLLLGGCQSVPIHGQGTYTAPNGNKYVGEWKNSKPHGQGTLTYADGGKYIGEFRNGKRNGQGTLTAPNGDKYINDLPISRLRDALRE
ncbi:MAG: hypothetical protein QGG48_08915, partial [Desulfatiglandales bacterium]|nr:hypothetical protein [Desulfatiglandales bacterium]